MHPRKPHPRSGCFRGGPQRGRCCRSYSRCHPGAVTAVAGCASKLRRSEVGRSLTFTITGKSHNDSKVLASRKRAEFS
ncbi:hypothetical protein NDU88_008262 [Pleurodeles waltl]|uniref:Uncharacterized protein n=1 Tax=Pleurodeles waltl TaxID=8319 RepID=A0AAV7QSA7_PLEWA|nr:hypothetical protein NDU88_008262 [Pleurodeles waltl]